MSKLFFVMLLLGCQARAQYALPSFPSDVDTTASVQTLTEQLGSAGERLLPHRMLFTQRIFWGQKGVLRTSGVAPLTMNGRKNEQKVRRVMLISHQITGYAAVAGLVAQGLLAAQLTHAGGERAVQLRRAQQTALTFTNVAYGTTALLSLTAPPRLTTAPKKGTVVRLHKYLATIHLTGFIVTNVLASRASRHAELKPYQQAATLATLATLAPSLIALKF